MPLFVISHRHYEPALAQCLAVGADDIVLIGNAASEAGAAPCYRYQRHDQKWQPCSIEAALKLVAAHEQVISM